MPWTERLGGSRPPVWVTPALVVATYVIATAANAGTLLFGAPPHPGGVLASLAYLAAWLGHAVVVGRCSRRFRALRRMAAFWAVAVGGTAICGTFLRLNLGTGAAIPGGWVAPAILLLVAAPLYGLAGWFGPDPLAVLVAVALACAALTLVAATARPVRSVRPATRNRGAASANRP